MRKFYYLLAVVAVVATSCQQEVTYTRTQPEHENISMSNSQVIPIEEALANLDEAIEEIYPNTRAQAQPQYSKEDIILFTPPATTRSNANVEIPDTLIYIVPFEESGYAILGAQRSISPIYTITEFGEFDIEKFSKALEDDINNNFLTEEEYQQRLAGLNEESDYDYSVAANPTDMAYALTANVIIGDLIGDDPVILDPTIPNPGDLDEPGPLIRYTETIESFDIIEHCEPLTTTLWDQEEPFNLLCKDSNGNLCYTGCTVTAVAQILAYHEYPVNPVFNGVTIDWDIVKSYSLYDYDSEYEINNIDLETDAVANQLANLFEGLGDEDYCDVKYSTSGSSSTINKAKNAFEKLGYKNLDIRLGFGEADREVAYNQIRNNRLIHMRGYLVGSGGHAWVVDGFVIRRPKTTTITYYTDGTTKTEVSYGESQELIHINWGWSGLHNGYFVAKSNIDTDNRYVDVTDSSHSIDTRGSRRHYNVSFKMLTYSL